jgi:SWI/SNF-related matrix-associated actin-dependent regulator 1 of chromatin subfamily A
VEYALSHHYSINACEMGLGKTVQAIAVLAELDVKTMVVCPAYLKRNWVKEIRKFVEPYDNLAPLILSYEEFTKNSGQYVEPKYLIFDEAHYLKNMTAKRTKAAHRYVKKVKPEYLLLLTGTPIKNRVAEFYSLLKLCSYNPRGTSGLPLTKGYHTFAEALSYRQEFRLPYGGKAVKYTGLRNKPLLLKYLKDKYFRRTAADELDLPGLTRNHIPIDIASEDGLQEDFDNGSTHLSSAKSNMAALKAPYTARYANDVLAQTEGPLLIFSDHVDSTRTIARELGGTYITGETAADKRASIVDLFQKGRINVLVATIGSMSTGWTLTAANRIIFNDLSWCPADNAQAEARICRIGQERACFVSYMVADGIDEQITRTLNEKAKVLNDLHTHTG